MEEIINEIKEIQKIRDEHFWKISFDIIKKLLEDIEDLDDNVNDKDIYKMLTIADNDFYAPSVNGCLNYIKQCILLIDKLMEVYYKTDDDNF